MRLTLIILALLTLQQSDCGEQQQSGGGYYVIRVCSERDAEEIGALVSYSNQWLAATDVRFTLASDSCDVTMKMVSGNAGGVERAEGVAYTIFGEIELQRGGHPSSLMHEVLHCAGVPHENDPTSIMWRYSGGPSELRMHHVEALRRLAGITPFGRIRAQVTSVDK